MEEYISGKENALEEISMTYARTNKYKVKGKCRKSNWRRTIMTTFILLSHDVDWGKTGPPISHVLARKERFDEETIRNLKRKNPYYNIPELLEIEDKFDVRSTFFFRTSVKGSTCPPPTYDLREYKSDIRSMIPQGWEVGLHSDPISWNSPSSLGREKKELESIAGTQIFGNRIHYTLNDMRLYPMLRKLNFKYDSSVKHCSEEIVEEDFGYFIRDRIIEFPITFMDALAFAYLIKTEADVLKLVKQIVTTCKRMHKKIATIIWHNCVLKMKYGRKYGEVLEYLTSLKNVYVTRGIDLANMIERGEL